MIEKLGFIGLGIMGKSMSQNLLKAMDLFTDEQHVLFLETLSFLSWLKELSLEKFRSDVLNCFR